MFSVCWQLVGLVSCYFLDLCLSLHIWLIKVIHKEQDFGHPFLLISSILAVQNGGILSQISGGEISEWLACVLPVSRRAVFLNPPGLSFEYFECRYWLGRRNITFCFFKPSTLSCFKKMGLLHRNMWHSVIRFLVRVCEFKPCSHAGREHYYMPQKWSAVLKMSFNYFSTDLPRHFPDHKGHNCCPS